LAGLLFCVVVGADAIAAKPGDPGAMSVVPVRAVEIEVEVSPASSGAAIVDPSTFRPVAPSSRPSNFALNASVPSGRIRAEFRAEAPRAQPGSSVARSKQSLSLNYDLWKIRGRLSGRPFEFSTKFSHRLSFDTLHDPTRQRHREDYRMQNSVVFDGKVGAIELQLRQGWSGGYVTDSSVERNDAKVDTSFDATLPVQALAQALGVAGQLKYAPKLLFRSSRYDASRARSGQSAVSETQSRQGVGVSFAGETWNARYLGSRRMRDSRRGAAAHILLRGIEHDLRFRFRPADRLQMDLGLRWDDIEEAGRRRKEIDRSLDVGWQFSDDASVAVGLFARERNNQGAGKSDRKHGLETRLELPIRPVRGWRPLGTFGCRFVVKQNLAVVDTGRGGGSNEASWSVLCSLELSAN
jgi:hypothetical protein